MPVTMRTILLAGAVLALPACTFVKMAPGAQQVKVLAAAPVGCERRADVAVSVTHQVGFYERSDTQVRDELETLARNEAPAWAPTGSARSARPRTAASAGRPGAATEPPAASGAGPETATWPTVQPIRHRMVARGAILCGSGATLAPA